MFSQTIQQLFLRLTKRPRGDWLVAAAWCLVVVAGTCRASDSAGRSDAEPAAPGPAELSVAPLEFPSYPDGRPDWIDQPPQLDGAVHRWPVVSVPSLDRARCRESLREQTRLAIAAYANHLFEHQPGGRREGSFEVDDSLVRACLGDGAPSYQGTVGTSDGDLVEVAELLHFDGRFRDRLRSEWRNQQVGRRLMRLGLLGGGSMALLVSLSTFLRWSGFRAR